MNENSEGDVPRGKPTSEEDDLKVRSTKKVKPNEVGEAEVIMDDPISESTGDQPKHSYCDGAAGSTVVDGATTVVENQPVQEGNHDPGSLGGVDEKISQSLDNGLTNEDTGFGPWMIAKNPFRRKFPPKSAEKIPSGRKVEPSGSRFIALQQQDSAADVSNNKNNKNNKDNVKPLVLSQSVKVGLPHKPKVAKATNKPVKHKEVGKSMLNNLKPNVAEVNTLSPSVISSPSVPSTSTDSALLKQKEKEILRFVSRKQNEIWKAYKEGKPVDDYLDLSVHRSSEEDMEFVKKLLENDRGTDFLLSKPPDPPKLLTSSIASGSVPCDERAISSVMVNEEYISHDN
ncbi:hypothetical protein RIF29_10726 [Crotalaria pallida]|uniref:Uncharacterized protein n=1 Tax=Crotalaria pallida TaxID=3830 RepID=A0AAN9FT02_CROPI